jgi:hypothetical protein
MISAIAVPSFMAVSPLYLAAGLVRRRFRQLEQDLIAW